MNNLLLLFSIPSHQNLENISLKSKVRYRRFAKAKIQTAFFLPLYELSNPDQEYQLCLTVLITFLHLNFGFRIHPERIHRERISDFLYSSNYFVSSAVVYSKDYVNLFIFLRFFFTFCNQILNIKRKFF